MFNLNAYDVVAFDMDHTLIQYHLPEIFKLIYTCTVEYLVKEKNYGDFLHKLNNQCRVPSEKHYGDFLHKDNFEKYKDFSLRGLVFDCIRGNFLKLHKDGYILRCSHGLKSMSNDYISRIYGIERFWPQFPTLKENVYQNEGYALLENFFTMPAALLVGEIIEEVDKSNDEMLSDYTLVWKEVAAALLVNFQPSSFKADLGLFFPSLKKNTELYVKKCPLSILAWIKKLRAVGKMIMLITDSYADFADFIMNFSFGTTWKESFDFIIVAANKPNFFRDGFKERHFLSVHNGDLTSIEVVDLQKHTMYARGHAWQLEKVLRANFDSFKVVYFGDSMRSDIYPPKKFMNWDTVAVLEELEAEEVHFHKNNNVNEALFTEKHPRVSSMLKEEKLIIASNQWGSLFTDDFGNSSKSENHPINTFWGDIVRCYSRLAIPLLDYIAENDLNFNYASFDVGENGFYPSPPKSLEEFFKTLNY